MSKFKNNRELALSILRGRWLISEEEADRLLPIASSFLRKEFVTAEVEDVRPVLMNFEGEMVQADGDVTIGEPMVLVVPIVGTMTKSDNCYGTSTLEVASILDYYRQDANVVGFVLDIDSPGGAVNSVMPLVEAIRKIQAEGKPIIAHCDLVASAAYWIASQTDAVFMDNILSSAGSIGACAKLVDDRVNAQTGERHLTIYAPQSTDKNRAVREALDGKTETLESELSEIVKVFQDAVKSGRKGLKADAPGVLSGAMFTTQSAIETGLADGQADLDDCIQNVYVRAHQF